MTKLADRVLVLEGVHNFRDFGGYPVPGEGRLRRGVLWRSGQHSEASEADLERIAALELRAVFDLRGAVERARHPRRSPPGFAGKLFVADDTSANPAQPPSAGMAPHVAAAAALAAQPLAERRRDAESTRATMRRAYTTLPYRPAQVAAMRCYIAELAELDGASVINCMAGKDRTGIAVALLQRALGVHGDDIMADYLLTNTAGDPAARIAAGARSIRVTSGELDPEVLRVIMSVEPEYLDTAFAVIAESHGSVEAYMAAELGVGDGLRKRLLARLVA